MASGHLSLDLTRPELQDKPMQEHQTLPLAQTRRQKDYGWVVGVASTWETTALSENGFPSNRYKESSFQTLLRSSLESVGQIKSSLNTCVWPHW